ncbi:hypothetical protein V8E54_012773 [Elaphomyces granulatus]|jgi:hypothetical protein
MSGQSRKTAERVPTDSSLSINSSIYLRQETRVEYVTSNTQSRSRSNTGELSQPDSECQYVYTAPKSPRASEYHEYQDYSRPPSPDRDRVQNSSRITTTSSNASRPGGEKSQQDSSRRNTSDDYRRYSGTVNHYGRHSNEWLFNGFSVRDTVRDGIEKLRHHPRSSTEDRLAAPKEHAKR